MFKKFIENKTNLIAKNEQDVLFLEGKRLDGSNFDHWIRNLYVANAEDNLTAIYYLSQAL